jgi:eukaryotic-like serine/threonine-protein kinase
VASDVPSGAPRRSVPVPEADLGLAGAVIISRYLVNAVSSVNGDVVVYRAEDTRHGRPIALKVLRGELAGDPEFVAAVRTQSRVLARSAHVLRGVQRVYECGDTETGQPFVALEWVEGATLGKVLDAGGALAAATALRVAIRIGEALEALHHNGLVHGRLGPDSVVMVRDGERVRLLGAELAAAYRTPIGRRAHDPLALAYPAPEQAERDEATEATDVYALGMLLRQLLTAGKGDQTPPLSPAIQRIIATATEARPERRYADISVMVNDIWGAAAVVTERESPRRSLKASGNARHRVRRRRGRFSLRVAAAVVAAGITAAVVWVAAIDRIATRLSSDVTPPAVTALPAERSVPPPSQSAAPPAERSLLPPSPSGVPPGEVSASASAPRESTAPPEPSKVEDKPQVEQRASRPPTQAPRTTPPATAPPTIDAAPRALVESSAPVVRRAPVASPAVAEPPRSTEPAAVTSPAPIERHAVTAQPPATEPVPVTSDGSAAIDWLLKERR